MQRTDHGLLLHDHHLLPLSLLMSSPIDSLPLDTLVQVLCKLSHDELKPLLTVSKTFHNAALAAQHSHFDYSTPQRSKTSAVFDRSKDRDQPTPDAPLPKIGSRKTRAWKLSEDDTRRVATVLFPAGNCERRLAFKSVCRGCSLATKHNKGSVFFASLMPMRD